MTANPVPRMIAEFAAEHAERWSVTCTRCGAISERDAQGYPASGQTDLQGDYRCHTCSAAEQAEAAALINARTIADQQRTIHDLQAAAAKADAATKDALMQGLRAHRALVTLRDELSAIVIGMEDLALFAGEKVSLWELYQKHEFEGAGS